MGDVPRPQEDAEKWRRALVKKIRQVEELLARRDVARRVEADDERRAPEAAVGRRRVRGEVRGPRAAGRVVQEPREVRGPRGVDEEVAVDLEDAVGPRVRVARREGRGREEKGMMS